MIQLSEEEYERLKATEKLLKSSLRVLALLRGRESSVGIWIIRIADNEIVRVPPIDRIEVGVDHAARETIISVFTFAAPRTASA